MIFHVGNLFVVLYNYVIDQLKQKVHTICKGIARELSASFGPDTLLAIGGGGYFPARVMRTFLPGTQIVAATLKLYNDTTHEMGQCVVTVQWPDEAQVESATRGKNV